MNELDSGLKKLFDILVKGSKAISEAIEKDKADEIKKLKALLEILMQLLGGITKEFDYYVQAVTNGKPDNLTTAVTKRMEDLGDNFDRELAKIKRDFEVVR